MPAGSREKETMRFMRRGGTSIAGAAAYVAIRLGMHMVGPGILDPRLAIVSSIAIMMLVQLALVVSIARLQMKPRLTALWALLFAVGFVGMVLLPRIGHAGSAGAEIGLAAVQDLLLMLTAAFLGCTISYVIREPNILLPAAVFAGLVDYWSVSWGPLSRIMEKKPSVVAAMSVHVPTPVPGVPGTMIGMGDFVFLALFFGVLYRFGMNVRGAFWLGYLLLTAAMLVVLGYGGALPALVPMGVAVVATNIRRFHLNRDELLATLYVGVLLLVLLVASGVFLFRR